MNGNESFAWDLSPVWAAFAETGARFTPLDEVANGMLRR